MSHTHPDAETLTVACPGCVARVKADQVEASIAAAPLRRCTWRCEYTVGGEGRELEFELTVRVPAGWDGADVDDRYMSASGEAFVMALPADVSMDDTGEAAETMEVLDVVIGPVVAEPKPELVTEPLPL